MSCRKKNYIPGGVILQLAVTLFLLSSFHVKSQTIQLSTFKAIRCSGNVQIRYQTGPTSSITFHNLNNERIKYSIDNERLTIKGKPFDQKQPREIITITGSPVYQVRVQKNAIVILDSLTLADSCKLIAQTAGEIKANVNNSFLSIEAMTGSLIQISGSTQKLQLKCSGSSIVRARHLIFSNAQLKVRTKGFVEVKNIGNISGKVSSGGELKIIGDTQPQAVTTSTKGKITLSNE
ncbi:MAG TPA: DUF2807 domain-containing protein [Salinivirgaceae bacterium]|nr:DUF2807 domain-containing protein [Salinivirgaceae bacterium]